MVSSRTGTDVAGFCGFAAGAALAVPTLKAAMPRAATPATASRVRDAGVMVPDSKAAV
ncbi:hypothetical protein Mco01_53970 [Microbispora corallina]|uniref:Uncharacterized protein n=1 Tax=Microbispora corallina TaxID=83302 RepID=A0ABQ4G5S2_9ACTN|nr:hypothetical protein Mco01_53970 [Microbispora corallina]